MNISNYAEGELYNRDKPLIGHWVVDLLKSDFVQTICIISNAHFYNQFEQWYNQLEDKSRIVLLNDGSTSNETRLGAGKDSNLQNLHRFAARLFARKVVHVRAPGGKMLHLNFNS